MSFAIILAAYILADAYCYVHGHHSLFFSAKRDYEKKIIDRIRGNANETNTD